MYPQEILQGSPDNYMVRTEEVESIKLTQGHYYTDSGQESPNKMVIKWSGRKEKL